MENVTGFNSSCYVIPKSDCDVFLFVINTVIIGSLIVIGLCGNSLTIVTLFTDSQVNVTSLLLIVLACCDSLFLASQLLFKSLTAMCRYPGYESMCSFEQYAWPYINLYIRPLGFAMAVASIWITLLVTIHRAVAVLIPHKAKSYATVKSVRIQCVTLIIIAVLMVIPKFFEFYIQTSDRCPPDIFFTELNLNPVYGALYHNILMNALVNIGPLIILFILTWFLIREIHNTIKQNKTLRGKQDQSQRYGTQLTVILTLVVVVFIICQIPHVIYILARLISKDQFQALFQCGRPWFYFFHISEMLIVLNASINFFLYCLAGARFRKMLAATFCNPSGFPKRSPTYKTNASTKPTGFTPLTTFSVDNGD